MDFYNDHKGVNRGSDFIKKEDHSHFFYTVDRKGNKMIECTASAGHKHQVETWVDEEGNLVGKCSSPIAHNGKVLPEDKHTHEVVYIKSARVHSKLGAERAKEIREYNKKLLESDNAESNSPVL